MSQSSLPAGTPTTAQAAGHSQLGKASAYVDQYDPGLLFPIARATSRAEIGVTGTPRFFGADLWTAFELGWLNPRGKPQVALAHILVPCESTHIVEGSASGPTSARPSGKGARCCPAWV